MSSVQRQRAMSEKFVDVVEVAPAVLTLEALLGGGWNSLSRRVRRALEKDDYSEALAAANADYSRQGAAHREAALVYAVLLVGRDLVDEAMGVLRQALTHHAQDVGLQLAQVEALVVGGDFEAAHQLLEALESVSTAEPRHWSFMGDMYLDMGSEEPGIACYKKALAQGLLSPEVAYRMAQLSEERDDLDATAHYTQMAARLAEDNPMLWQTAAELCFEVGRIDDAAEAYEQMLEDKPYDTDAWFMLGLCYRYLERWTDAARALEEVVSLNPRHRTSWTELGEVRLVMGRGGQALTAFEEALALADDDLEALNGAVVAAHKTGDVEAALKWAEKATAIAPDDRSSRYNYGVLLLSLRRGGAAESVLAPLTDESDPEPEPQERALYLGTLAVAELMSGHSTRAFEHIDQAQRLLVDPRWLAAFAEELLKQKGAQKAMAFIDDVDSTDPTWQVVRALLGYVCSGLIDDEERAGEYADRFRKTLGEQPQVVPVMWDFESWEAMAFRLERAYEQIFDAMLAIVEGRRELKDMESFLPESTS